jgi:hypothetical protein
MPILGIGLHIAVALFFAIHAVRTGREIYWLVILFMFPLLGSIVYFFAVFSQEAKVQHTVNRTVNKVVRSLDPGRDLREARAAFDMTPTAQNQLRLAQALLASGDTAQAIEQFEACLQGPFARDPDIRFGAAHARLQHGDAQLAVELLRALRADHPNFREEPVALLLAQAYSAAGNQPAAHMELRQCHERFGSLETKVEYALWAQAHGHMDTASSLRDEVRRTVRHMPKHARSINQPLLDRLNAAATR